MSEESPMGKRKSGKSSHWIQALFIGVAVLILLLAFSDVKAILKLFSQIHLPSLVWGLLFSFTSYFLITLSYRHLFNLLKYQLRLGELFTITVMSTLINYFLATGGVSGYALRAMLLKKRSIPVTVTLSVSLIQGVLTNVTVLILFAVNFYSYMRVHSANPGPWYILIFPMPFLAAYIFFILAVCFHGRWSAGILSFIEKKLEQLAKRKTHWFGTWPHRFNEFGDQFLEAASLFRAQQRSLWKPFIQIMGDWLFSMVCLYYCFLAVRQPLDWTVIASVYFIGVFISFVFVATGGLGIMEGGMSMVFTQFGVPWETALGAVLLYRFLYYVVPLLLILPSYLLFIRSEDE